MSSRAWILCEGCGAASEHHGRGLCSACYWRYRRAGKLDYFAPRTRRDADTIEDWEELRRQGYSRRDAVARLGISLGALEKALERTRRKVAS